MLAARGLLWADVAAISVVARIASTMVVGTAAVVGLVAVIGEAAIGCRRCLGLDGGLAGAQACLFTLPGLEFLALPLLALGAFGFVVRGLFTAACRGGFGLGAFPGNFGGGLGWLDLYPAFASDAAAVGIGHAPGSGIRAAHHLCLRHAQA